MLYQLLHTLGYGGLLLLFISVLVLFVLLFKVIANFQRVPSQAPLPYYLKKNPTADTRHYRKTASKVGWMLSLGLVLCAFELPQIQEAPIVLTFNTQSDYDSVITPPVIKLELPKPPKVQSPKIIEVPNEAEVLQVIDVSFPEEFVPEEAIEYIEEEPEEEVTEEPILIVEQVAEPKGGMNAFLKWVAKEVNYPVQARRMNLGGKVIVQFVVEKDGSLTGFKVLKGVGGGLDEEALRVLKLAPAWTPGKQRGRPVRSLFVLPVYFKIQ